MQDSKEESHNHYHIHSHLYHRSKFKISFFFIKKDLPSKYSKGSSCSSRTGEYERGAVARAARAAATMLDLAGVPNKSVRRDEYFQQ